MAETPTDKLDREKNNVDGLADDGNMSEECSDALKEWARALDEKKARFTYKDDEGNTKTYSPGTVETYLRSLRIFVERTDGDLLDLSAEEFNNRIHDMHDGVNPHVPDDGLSKSTLLRTQSAAKTFYRYYPDLGVAPDDIEVYTTETNPRHDEQDMFDEDEVDALRRAIGDSTRDRALLELLIFTGQRITALQTLRLKDVKPNEGPSGYIYLNDDYNEEHGGLKGALNRGRRRPMFGARKFVRDWLQYHPLNDGEHPDAPLFIGDPDHHMVDISNPEPLSQTTMRENLKKVAKKAGVDKPVNPHNFRHYFTTIMKRDYDLDDTVVKQLLGARNGSNIMNTTYNHVTDAEYIRKAEEGTGYRESEKETPLTPNACRQCGELLKDGWKVCPACGEAYGPTRETVDDVKESVQEGYRRADPTDADTIEKTQLAEELLDDPEFKNELMKKIADGVNGDGED